MKNFILIFTLISGFAFGQFTIKESSKDWTEIGSYWGNIYLYKKEDKAKLKFKDILSQQQRLSTPFKSQYQKNTDAINDNIEKNNKGIVDGFYEFEFSAKEEDLNKLYDLISKNLSEKKVEEITLQFPEGNMYLKFNKSFGIAIVSFGFDKNTDKLSNNITYSRVYTQDFGLKNIQKLFGK